MLTQHYQRRIVMVMRNYRLGLITKEHAIEMTQKLALQRERAKYILDETGVLETVRCKKGPNNYVVRRMDELEYMEC